MHWNRSVTAHPQLNGTDKLIYHLMVEFGIQKMVAEIIGKDSRVVCQERFRSGHFQRYRIGHFGACKAL